MPSMIIIFTPKCISHPAYRINPEYHSNPAFISNWTSAFIYLNLALYSLTSVVFNPLMLQFTLFKVLYKVQWLFIFLESNQTCKIKSNVELNNCTSTQITALSNNNHLPQLQLGLAQISGKFYTMIKVQICEYI